MKKLLFSLIFMAGTLAAQADDYAYLTFETTDGTRTSVAVSSLTLSISGTTLTAGNQSFTLSNLSKMYFSTSDETTGISDEIRMRSEEIVTDVYDLNGRKVNKDNLKEGVYVIKGTDGTYKIAVK